MLKDVRDGSAKRYRNKLKEASTYAAKQGMMACNNNSMCNPINRRCRD